MLSASVLALISASKCPASEACMLLQVQLEIEDPSVYFADKK